MRRFLSRLFKTALVLAVLWVCAAVYISIQGLRVGDDRSDFAVVFGNGLKSDGTPKATLAGRLDVALRCFQAGNCPILFLSGGIDGPGLDETNAMQDYLLARGVPAGALILDNQGDNTLATARNAARYMKEHGLSRVMLVTQYYHLPRAQLAFEAVGVSQTSGLFPPVFRMIDVYSSLREVPAYVTYALRLAFNPDSEPMSFRPWLSFKKLFTGCQAPSPPRARPSLSHRHSSLWRAGCRPDRHHSHSPNHAWSRGLPHNSCGIPRG